MNWSSWNTTPATTRSLLAAGALALGLAFGDSEALPAGSLLDEPHAAKAKTRVSISTKSEPFLNCFIPELPRKMIFGNVFIIKTVIKTYNESAFLFFVRFLFFVIFFMPTLLSQRETHESKAQPDVLPGILRHHPWVNRSPVKRKNR
ncbi:hypothetical protein [Cohnella caldifontis]|uniref:hypothetical protein n=1 Tax=Cohnella caldifontis TaxID=3027471 RepID=UPI0023EC5DD0|nr:hypothetical protein [Cohnella sp. YIM B05605]